VRRARAPGRRRRPPPPTVIGPRARHRHHDASAPAGPATAVAPPRPRPMPCRRPPPACRLRHCPRRGCPPSPAAARADSAPASLSPGGGADEAPGRLSRQPAPAALRHRVRVGLGPCPVVLCRAPTVLAGPRSESGAACRRSGLGFCTAARGPGEALTALADPGTCTLQDWCRGPKRKISDLCERRNAYS
jgi:hypothetical protein